MDLPPQQVARIAADPGGSRVMEAVIESSAANAKAKKKLLKKMSGYFGTIASTPAGNFLVEKCYTFAVSSLILKAKVPVVVQAKIAVQGVELIAEAPQYPSTACRSGNFSFICYKVSSRGEAGCQIPHLDKQAAASR